MDIQKEREAFELNVNPCVWERITYCAEHNIYIAKTKYWESTVVNMVVGEIDFGWKMWQAAKAQAVPEGFVLVQVSDIAKLAIAVSRVDLMTYSKARPDNEKSAWQNIADKLEAMIQSQEKL